MNNLIIFLSMLAVVGCSNNQQTPPSIQGRWASQFADGDDVLAVFRKDGTLDFFVNDKLFVTANYSFANDTLRASDPFCSSDYYASYKVDFISADSMRFSALQDTCRPRKRDLDGAGYKRIK